MNKNHSTWRLAYTSILLTLLALVCVTVATVAWMTIADQTRVRSMRMDITTGSNLRFDLDAHETFDEYVKTLSFNQIRQRILEENGYDPAEVPLEPVTTTDCVSFTLEDGRAAPNGSYLEFILHFMATEDMVVHLTSAHSANGNDGTMIHSDVAALPEAMRISFTAEETCVYDPGMGDFYDEEGQLRIFGLPDGDEMTYYPGNALFSLKKGVDKPVIVRIWLEGTDEACTDVLRNADYKIQLRFVGTDEEGNLLTDQRNAS